MGRAHHGSTSADALDLAPGLLPWEQQPSETAVSYARFLQFCDIDPVVRTKWTPRGREWGQVYAKLRDRDPEICSAATLKNVATLNRWHERAAALDKHNREVLQQATEQATRRWAERLAQRRAEIQLEHLEAAAEIRKRGMEALDNIALSELSGAEIKGIIELGYRMERETLDLARTRGTTAESNPHLNNLNEEQVSARLSELADELHRRMHPPTPSTAPSTAAAAAPDVLDAEVIEPGSSNDPPDWRPPGPERPALGPAEPA
jgi:hypothetical protein